MNYLIYKDVISLYQSVVFRFDTINLPHKKTKKNSGEKEKSIYENFTTFLKKIIIYTIKIDKTINY